MHLILRNKAFVPAFHAVKRMHRFGDFGSLLDLACIVLQISLPVARLLWLEYVGAFYYVPVRGNGRQAITRIGVKFLTSWVAK